MASESKVGGIMAALGELENDMDALNSSVPEMKRQLSIRVQKETDELYKKTREMATARAEAIMEGARKEATARASDITARVESRLAKIRADIDAGFEDAVRGVVARILSPDG